MNTSPFDYTQIDRDVVDFLGHRMSYVEFVARIKATAEELGFEIVETD